MTTDRELMQQALDALEVEHSAIYGTSQTAKAIEALRARLAQSEQEPVASMVITMGEVTSMQPYKIAAEMLDGTHQLYTAPPQREWQKLTDEEYRALLQQADYDAAVTGSVFQNLRHAIEAKLKDKNT